MLTSRRLYAPFASAIRMASIMALATSVGLPAMMSGCAKESGQTARPSVAATTKKTADPQPAAKTPTAKTVTPAKTETPAATGSDKASTAAPTSAGDALVLATPKGLMEMSLSGKLRPLAPGAVGHCQVDTRLNGLWFATPEAGNPHVSKLQFMERGKAPFVVSEKLDQGPDGAFSVNHGKFGALGEISPSYYHVMTVLELAVTPPRWSGKLGCDGHFGSGCYKDDAGTTVTDEVTAQLAKAKAHVVLNGKRLAALSVAAGQRALSRDRKVNCEGKKASSICATIKVPNVAAKDCEIPEYCGIARKVVGTTLFLANVHNEREDSFHEMQQFYDPATKMYLHPDDPTKLSPKPHMDKSGMFASIGAGYIGRNGHWYAGGKLWSLTTMKVIAKGPKDAIPCGFWGGWHYVEPGL